MPAVTDRKPVLSVQAIRRGLGISQEAMSQLLRVSAKTVSRWEKEQGQPRSPD
jgi:DNA-binding transcriptional regulator YiaG